MINEGKREHKINVGTHKYFVLVCVGTTEQ